MIKRALYYAARELSAQLGTLTKRTNYGQLEKVYSIWICNKNIPEELRDTATEYSIRKSDIIGTTEEPEETFDLLNVIMIRRGGKSREKIFDFLTSVFEGQISKIRKYTDVIDHGTLEQEVKHMSGLGASILEEGIEQGIELATTEFIKQMLKQGETEEKIMMYANCTMEDVRRVERQIEEESHAQNAENISQRNHKRSR